MKLRLRSLETLETLKIEVTTPCSLQHLKEIVSQRTSSSSFPASVHLSLNRKDELLGSSPQDSLQSLGVTSGDLIFFTFNHNAFSSVQSYSNPREPSSTQPRNSPESNPAPESNSAALNTQKEETMDFDSVETETLESNTQENEPLEWNTQENETLDSHTQTKETLDFESVNAETSNRDDQTVGVDTDTPGMSGTETMDVDDDRSVVGLGKSFSVPCFLRRVFSTEVGEGGGGNHKLLVIAVHAVLLESNFVAFDSVSMTKVKGFHLPDVWPVSAFTMSLRYTLPEIIDRGPSAAANGDGIETVVLKFQSVGKFVKIYGSLARKGCKVHGLSLDEERTVFFLNLMWASSDSITEMTGKGSFSNIYPEREVFEFWKTVKDRLALPLLIDLCENAGLDPPPCFMRLPTDLKLDILKYLPGVDVARVGCVCSELQYLSSNDDLWKQKCVELLGNAEGSQGGSQWKKKFAKSWETRKRRKTITSHVGVRPIPYMLPRPRIIRDPYPFGFPGIIGGDHDLVPGGPFGQTFPTVTRRNIIPPCDLEGNTMPHGDLRGPGAPDWQL